MSGPVAMTWDAARAAFIRAARAYEGVGSLRGTGSAILGLAAVEAAAGQAERALLIANAAEALSAREGIVLEHPMDPGLKQRIDALKATVPPATLDGLVANAAALSTDEVLRLAKLLSS